MGALIVAQSFFIPVVSALFITLIISPLRRGLERSGMSSHVAAFLLLLALILSVALICVFASSGLQSVLANRAQITDQLVDRLNEWTHTFGALKDVGQQVDEIAGQTGDRQVVVVREEGPFALMTHATPIIVGQVILTLTLALFLIASGDMFYEKLVECIPSIRNKKKALDIARDIERQLSTYFLTVTAINAGVAVFIGIAFWAIGMPHPLLFLISAFFLNFIPYVGPLAGVGGAFLVGALTYSNLLGALVPAAIYWTVMTVEGQLVTPILLGKRLSLNSVVVLLSVTLWAWLWGFAGVLLATPILIATKVASDRISFLSGVSTFLADRSQSRGADKKLIERMFAPKPKPAPEPAADLAAEPVLAEVKTTWRETG